MNKFTNPTETDRQSIQDAFGNFMERFEPNIKTDSETLLEWSKKGWIEKRMYGCRIHWLRKVFPK